jgi:uncharacterized membrane protein YgdD (TMEM256/DUF423 family)
VKPLRTSAAAVAESLAVAVGPFKVAVQNAKEAREAAAGWLAVAVAVAVAHSPSFMHARPERGP